jgi:preprotein translocase subunit SecE
VARDRKRSRQRRPRPVREGASAPSQNRAVRGDLPGSLDHVGDVDEFDAALVRGADGVPVETPLDAGRDTDPSNGSPTTGPSELVPAGGGRGGRSGGGDGGGDDLALEPAGEGAVPAPRPARPEGNRAIAFLRASWAELQRVQWPDRRQVSQATAVVLGFVAVAGAYLGAADWAAQKIVNFIL